MSAIDAFTARSHWYDEVDSTMPLARRAAEQGAPGGTAIVARAQRAGRGRGGSRWASPAGSGLYASVVLWPTAAWPLASLSPAMALAARAACLAAGAAGVWLKWPNDLVTDAGKVAGLLLESGEAPGGRRFVVLGIGLNLRAPERDVPAKAGAWALPAAGLFPAATTVTAEALWRQLHRGLAAGFHAWQREGFAPLAHAWNRAHALWRRPVVALGAGEGGEDWAGEAGCINADGSLTLQCAGGPRVLHVGSLRPADHSPKAPEL